MAKGLDRQVTKEEKKRTLDMYMVEGLEWGINLSGNKRNLNNNEIFSTKQTENIFITEISRVDKGLGKRVLICYWFSSILIKNFKSVLFWHKIFF